MATGNYRAMFLLCTYALAGKLWQIVKCPFGFIQLGKWYCSFDWGQISKDCCHLHNLWQGENGRGWDLAARDLSETEARRSEDEGWVASGRSCSVISCQNLSAVCSLSRCCAISGSVLVMSTEQALTVFHAILLFAVANLNFSYYII